MKRKKPLLTRSEVSGYQMNQLKPLIHLVKRQTDLEWLHN